MDRVTSVSFFHFTQNRFWAFRQMGLAPQQFKRTEGLSFFKFLGTGGGQGFSLWPDFSTYALLGVWNSQQDFEKQRDENPIYKAYQNKCKHSRHLLLKPFQSHGQWSGKNPFQTTETPSPQNPSPLVIITRATLRWNRLFSFWRAVPKASKAIEQAQGVRYYKGIGEWPFIQQATLSIWDDAAAVQQFAYRSQSHAQIVKTTRQKKWYKEDLFVRFALIDEKEYFTKA